MVQHFTKPQGIRICIVILGAQATLVVILRTDHLRLLIHIYTEGVPLTPKEIFISISQNQDNPSKEEETQFLECYHLFVLMPNNVNNYLSKLF